MPGVSQKFPPEKFNSIFRNVPANEPLRGLTHNPDTGDVTVAAALSGVRVVGKLVWDALGFLDIIDQQQSAAQQQAAAQNARLAETQIELKNVQSQMQELQANINTLINFFGVTIPAWINKEEVENGDDMGLVRPSALSLELIVEFQFEQATPGFGHEDVVSITPPAGSLVKRGSKVTVAINLEG